MKIEDLIDDKNEALYHRVSKKFNVKLEENQDWRAEVWVSKIEQNTATIFTCPTNFPKAAFVHELLRIDTQAKGFKRILGGISLDKDIQKQIYRIIKLLNNVFQHHKMKKEFLSPGYLPAQIYDDDGISEFSFLEEQLRKERLSTTSLSLLYLSFIDPLMPFSDEEKDAIIKKFEEYEDGSFKNTLKKIDNTLQQWVNDKSYQAENYQIEILQNAEITNTWLSYKQESPGTQEHEFPKDGFFVDNSFTFDEISKVYGD